MILGAFTYLTGDACSTMGTTHINTCLSNFYVMTMLLDLNDCSVDHTEHGDSDHLFSTATFMIPLNGASVTLLNICMIIIHSSVSNVLCLCTTGAHTQNNSCEVVYIVVTLHCTSGVFDMSANVKPGFVCHLKSLRS